MSHTAICVAVMLSVLGWGCRLSAATESVSKALFAYGAINAYMTSIWVAKEQGFFRKHNVEVEPVFIIATQAAQAMLAGEVQVGLIGPPLSVYLPLVVTPCSVVFTIHTGYCTISRIFRRTH
jgi:ABC-type nitrate/sulfonate/bicarbonate transport system substrate-binding protein